MFLKQSAEVKFYSPVCKTEQWDESDVKLLLLWVILIREKKIIMEKKRLQVTDSLKTVHCVVASSHPLWMNRNSMLI